jgi:WD40 repeat protein
LLRIDPHVFRRVRQGRTDLVALCDCGVFGPPQAIGWMGGRCGPCHDRGESAAPSAARQAWLWQGGEWECRCLAFSPDGAWLAVGGNAKLRLFEVATGACRALEVPDEHNLSVAFSPDGRTLAVGRGSGDVLLLDPATGRPKAQARLQGPDYGMPIWDVHFTPAGERVYARWTYGSSYRLVSWDVTNGQCHLIEPPLKINSLDLSPEGRTLAANDWVSKTHLLDLASGTWRPSLEFTDGRPSELAFSPDGRTLACCLQGNNPRVAVLDLATGRSVREYPETQFDPRRSGWEVAFTPDGRTLVTHIEAAVQSWDVATEVTLARLDFLDERIQSLAVSPTGLHLAVGSYTGTVRLLPVELLRAD